MVRTLNIFIKYGLLIVWGVLCLASPVCADDAGEKYEFASTRELVAFVRSAADLVAQKGEACFPELNKKGGKWYNGDRYVFVTMVDGLALVNPPFPDAIGKSLWQVQDSWGKPIVQLNVDSLKPGKNGKDEGWIHYLWPRPGSTEPEWKTSYAVLVTGPHGKQYIVASGAYDLKIEKIFIEDLVKNAVALIKKNGKKAFETLNDKSSKYQFRDIYVFVMTEKGLELCNPGTPQIVGKNVWGYKSVDGKNVVQEMVKLAKERGGGWVSYIWTKPGQNGYFHKYTFCMGVAVDGELLIVASGYYRQD